MVRNVLTILLFFSLFQAQAQEKIYVSINSKPITFQGSALYFGLDADAERYIDTVLYVGGSLTTTDISNIDYTVRALKKQGIWVKLKAYYPLMGGKPAPASFNLIDVTIFQITWSNVDSTMLDGQGWQANLNGFGNSNLTPSVTLETNNAMMGCYAYQNKNEASFHMGARSATEAYWAFTNRSSGNEATLRMYKSSVTSAANTSSLGLTIAQRTADNFAGLYQSSSLIVSTTTPSGAIPTRPIFLSGFNDSGSPNARSSNKYGAFIIGNTLTADQRAALRTIVNYHISRRTP